MKKICGGLLVWLVAFAAFADLNATRLAEADNGFAFDLLKQIEKSEPAKNIFISPYSVSTALQMLGNGAAGQTRAEIQDVLKTGEFRPIEVNETSKELNDSLLSQPEVTLDLSDSIWFNTGFKLKPGFVSANKIFFQAELSLVDFETPESADIINAWAEKKTRGKITGVVSFPFPPATTVVLANAIYFKGKWTEPFDSHETRLRDFFVSSGAAKQTLMMGQHKTFSYQEGDNFQAVKLPYAGGQLEMILFLPATHSSPEQLLAGLSGTNWNDEILPRFSDCDGTVVFPKFRLDYDVTLNGPLQALGMQQAFNPTTANFSAMADEPLFVSLVKQKSYVDVNEEGTEAAAVTTILMTRAVAFPMQKPFEMIVDRPFFFIIADNSTGAILFTGIVNDPTL